MLECMIIGDSIALGTAHVRTECVSYSVEGINTRAWNKKFDSKNIAARTVIISLGTNDHRGVNTHKELSLMRSRVKADRVFWILPPCNDKFCKPDINGTVKTIALSNNDTIIKTDKLNRDAIHPSQAGYTELAEKTR